MIRLKQNAEGGPFCCCPLHRAVHQYCYRLKALHHCMCTNLCHAQLTATLADIDVALHIAEGFT